MKVGRPNRTGINWRSGSPEEKSRMREYQRKYRRNNPDKTRDSNLRSKYGLSLEGYNQLFDEQEGRCAICSREQDDENLCVDHCHTSGEIRGLLCRQCNRAIGLLGDDTVIIRKALEYLS